MLKEERQQFILNYITQNYRVYITTLSTDLGVSDDTLRRDLLELDERGLLTKVHGGAIAKSGFPVDFTDRLHTGLIEKQQMAAKVIPLFKSGDVVLIDGGTSNLEVAHQIPPDMELTVYTNSFPIANALMHHPTLELVFIGGRVFPSSQVTLGVSVFRALQTVRPNWLVLGVCSVHPQLGLTTPDREETMIKQFMMERSQKRIVLAESHKLNKAEVYTVAPLGDIDYLITEDSKVNYINDHWPKHSYIVM